MHASNFGTVEKSACRRNWNGRGVGQCCIFAIQRPATYCLEKTGSRYLQKLGRVDGTLFTKAVPILQLGIIHFSFFFLSMYILTVVFTDYPRWTHSLVDFWIAHSWNVLGSSCSNFLSQKQLAIRSVDTFYQSYWIHWYIRYYWKTWSCK